MSAVVSLSLSSSLQPPSKPPHSQVKLAGILVAGMYCAGTQKVSRYADSSASAVAALRRRPPAAAPTAAPAEEATLVIMLDRDWASACGGGEEGSVL